LKNEKQRAQTLMKFAAEVVVDNAGAGWYLHKNWSTVVWQRKGRF
jgi:hypothetical protein